MALKRNDRLDDEPAAPLPESEGEGESSSAGEDEEEAEKQAPYASSAEDEDEEEEVDDDQPVQPQNNLSARKPETAISREESDSDDSGSETESDSGTPSPKPVITKPKEQASQTAKFRSKPAPSPAKPAVKRAGDAGQAQKSSKRPKKEDDVSAVAEDDSKKLHFQRKWSEDDEVAVLNGMLEYYEKKGTDPMADMSGFHDFIKKSLHFDVSKTQLADKLRRLKKKYVNNQGKGRNGEDPSFSKAHEQKSFELSKLIWRDNGVPMDSESAPKANGKARKTPQKAIKQEVKPEVFSPSNVKKEVKMESAKMETDLDIDPSDVTICSNTDKSAHVERKILKRSGGIVPGAKKEELDEEWRELKIMELELYLKRQALVTEHARLLLEYYKSLDE